MPVVASFVSTFLKPEMLHVYRQITGLKRYTPFAVTQQRLEAERYPMPPSQIRVYRKKRVPFYSRYWMKHILKKPPLYYRGEYRGLLEAISAGKPNLMHVYFGHTGVHLLPFIQRWEKPTIVSFHGMDVQDRKGQPGYLDKMHLMLQTIPIVLARSQSLADRLIDLGCPKEKIRINRTGIPLETFPLGQREYPEQGDWRLVQACRLIEKKGIETTFRAFKTFLEVYPNATLTLAGEGPLFESLQAKAAELGIASSIRWAGFLSPTELNELYQNSHFFLHPSQLTEDQNQEGVPNSMLEAMATGLPVFATYHGGIPEAVNDLEHGRLVQERDHEALGHALLEVAADASLWNRLGHQASLSVREKFERNRSIEKLESFYDEAVASNWKPTVVD